MHVKTDSVQSELTSLDASTTPPRSPRRPLYYVQSPSQHDVEKMSYGTSSPMGSPGHHHHYHCSPIHHSRESSTSRFSASLKGGGGHHRNALAWKKVNGREPDDGVGDDGVDEDDDDGHEKGRGGHSLRFYGVCFVLSFTVLFAMFSLILWGTSKSYEPHVLVKVFFLHLLFLV
ncbi:hypothetical protein Dimus_002774 [Dionaea muscipula]